MNRFLLCKPLYFDVDYEINPWMNKRNRPDKDIALEQWQTLHDGLIEAGAEISLITPQPQLPDMVFTANGGLTLNNKVYLSRFAHPERQEEEKHWKQWFNDNKFDIYTSLHCFEGAGDALWNGESMFCGYGFRSDLKATNRILYDILRNVDHKHFTILKLNDPYFYHLDTCFCPLNEEVALVWPGAFTDESFDRLNKCTNLIKVSREDARKFACNAVVVDDKIFMPAGCVDTEQKLERNKFVPIPIPMSEFIKSGGACKCLTLRI